MFPNAQVSSWAFTNVGWFPWVFCPCSLQGRQHFHSPLHISVPVHILHHHPCTSWCPQHHTAMICTQLQPWRERGDADAGVPNTSSSHKQHKRKRGEGEEGRREERRFSIQSFKQLAGVWFCSHSFCLDEPGREWM